MLIVEIVLVRAHQGKVLSLRRSSRTSCLWVATATVFTKCFQNKCFLRESSSNLAPTMSAEVLQRSPLQSASRILTLIVAWYTSFMS